MWHSGRKSQRRQSAILPASTRSFVFFAAAICHQNGRSLLGSSDPICGNLIWLPANLLSGTLSRQGLLQSPLRARLQVVGVTLHFLDDVFRLNLALEPAQGILQRFTFLQSNFCQADHPQTSPDATKERLHQSEARESRQVCHSCIQTSMPSGTIHIQPHAQVRIEGSADPVLLRVLLACLRR